MVSRRATSSRGPLPCGCSLGACSPRKKRQPWEQASGTGDALNAVLPGLAAIACMPIAVSSRFVPSRTLGSDGLGANEGNYLRGKKTSRPAGRPVGGIDSKPGGLRLNRDRHLHRRMDAAAYVIDAGLREGHHDLHVVGVHPLVFGTAVRVVDGDV